MPMLGSRRSCDLGDAKAIVQASCVLLQLMLPFVKGCKPLGLRVHEARKGHRRERLLRALRRGERACQ